jgi:hypothetical protein
MVTYITVYAVCETLHEDNTLSTYVAKKMFSKETVYVCITNMITDITVYAICETPALRQYILNLCSKQGHVYVCIIIMITYIIVLCYC